MISKGGGGAGWGNPLDRNPERVREDVEEMKVSIRRARNVYGVVINPRTRAVDYKATEELRKTLRDNPLYRHLDLVLEDVRKDKIPIQQARDVYGVVIKEDRGHLVVDYRETQRLRPK